MSTYLSAQSLSVSFASSPLFEEVSFTINQGDRIGLIGHNGCGKSTLLKQISGVEQDYNGQVIIANRCILAYVEQHLPQRLAQATLIQALEEKVSQGETWRAEQLLSELGFSDSDWHLTVGSLSGGQHMRLLLARAIINQPDLLLLDEPSNHLDLPALLWLENFLNHWKGSFVVVSHDQALLDRVTNATWIMRDRTLHHFSMPCSLARGALTERDEADLQRHASEQKEIDRLEQSAKRLATWGKVYDNEDLARKAKTMQARKERLVEQQTRLTDGAPWTLSLQGDALPANRLIDIEQLSVRPPQSSVHLFDVVNKQVKSGDRVAIMGSNGTGKSSLLKQLYSYYQQRETVGVKLHPQCKLGYYDQSLQQLQDEAGLNEALSDFAPLSDDMRKQALISAGFEYQRHQQSVSSLSGGERARLLFIGLTLARYHMLFLDEPTNHLDLEGKEELFETLKTYPGGALIVSHDRQLIEQSCNRFWLIQHGELTEYLSVEEVYQQLHANGHVGRQSDFDRLAACHSPVEPQQEDDALLERLLELEQLLEDDKRRKPKHQKPALQAKWQQEIDVITARL
ncbi:ABC-F family ATP-binding cassette domain-containing protein [Vibrio sp. V39_P1S14PM300]|uniref:ABC-F family ATP-binding cassette domain-containing protein n=1 Tax=Vibrio sp. V39_P1S14PM300 TaxID=1938690 RepID=UPI00137231E9|nr:ABC-F family ATP-binding cassette domain-containing protein [Vibrio sp. V39_P1S14PM300]NAX21636.1 ATP-binding cassette domain-containing protein [Vibrio sp. V39_P1S14PM300]